MTPVYCERFAYLHSICDLSCENVLDGSHSNAERNGKRTGENFQTDEMEQMNGRLKLSNG